MKNLREQLLNMFKKKDPGIKDSMQSVKNWYSERYESVIIQRNFLFLLVVVSIIAISLSIIVIRYIKSTRSIEPFVIEIERKTGVPTVVDPATAKAYTGDDAVKRYFVMQYIRAREEYIPILYQTNWDTVRILSSDMVFGGDYKPKFSKGNPNSPVNLFKENNFRKVNLKSIIFPTNNAAQIRVQFEVYGIMTGTQDKIIYMEYQFTNLQLTDAERLINPLGFQVTNYRIEDEKGVSAQ